MRIYVGNLSFNTTESDLNEAFSAHGQVTSANVIIDRETGASRGFGFVEMPDSAQAQRAIQSLNGADLGGRTLRVNEAHEGGDRRGGGGGGGGRSSGGGRGPRW
jgi:RNA recognition motif-containing protein